MHGSGGERLPADLARRIALAAQGFAEPRPVASIPEDAAAVRQAIARVGMLQLDSTNVLCRSHYLPVFARLGAYPRALLDDMSWGTDGRELFEYWAHKASLLPLATQPLLRWRMRAAERHDWRSWDPARPWRANLDPALHLAPWAVIEGMVRLAGQRPALVRDVLAAVAERGPVTARELVPPGQQGQRGSRHEEGGRMWNWHDAKIALEWLLYMGKVTTATRRGFERVYDLTERVIPEAVLAGPTPSQEEAQRELVRIAARALGVATERDLRDYFHLPPRQSKARVAELADAGELVPVRVEGLTQQMYLWDRMQMPQRVQARALLSPFDSLIWERYPAWDRTRALFGFDYRIAIYTPAARRTQGYYVLPFLLGDTLVARVDLKADRPNSALLVRSAHAEQGAGREVAGELGEELRQLAAWLELDRVMVAGPGNLGPALAQVRAVATGP
jgi:uncharacterized protein YcaQ